MRGYPKGGARHVAQLAGLLVFSVTAGPFAAQAYQYDTERDEMRFQAGEVEGITLDIGLKTAGRVQYLSHDKAYQTPRPSIETPDPQPVELGDPEWGFQTPWGSMDFLATFDDLLEVYWEFFISSRPHPDAMQGSQGYMLIHGLPGGQLQSVFDVVDIKAGEFEVNFGDHIYRQSDNARVQRNPLIGNYVIAPRATETGLEVSTKNERLNGLLGVTSGTSSGDFEDGRGTGLHTKFWWTPEPGYPAFAFRLLGRPCRQRAGTSRRRFKEQPGLDQSKRRAVCGNPWWRQRPGAGFCRQRSKGRVGTGGPNAFAG